MFKVAAFIFARYNSKRLPGKVLIEFGKRTVLQIVVDKLRLVPDLRIVVATSTESSDQPIVDWCTSYSVDYCRGGLEDVASRAEKCLSEYSCDAFFRINADSPFIQLDLLNSALQIVRNDPSVDLVTNVWPRSFPYGIAVELLKASTFQAHRRFFNTEEQEHITSYFYKHSDLFFIKNIKNESDVSRFKFVLDTPEDLRFITDLLSTDPNIFEKHFNQLLSKVQ